MKDKHPAPNSPAGPDDPPPAAAEATDRKRVMLVDDHPMTRGGMAQVINKQTDLAVGWEAGSAAEALDLLSKVRPDGIVTDITMPGRGGLEFIKDVQAMYPGLPILVVTLHDESLYAERALRAGARGYLMKDAGAALLLQALRLVLGGRTYVSPQMASRIVDLFSGQRTGTASSAVEKLTDREFEVFQLIGQGMTSPRNCISVPKPSMFTAATSRRSWGFTTCQHW